MVFLSLPVQRLYGNRGVLELQNIMLTLAASSNIFVLFLTRMFSFYKVIYKVKYFYIILLYDIKIYPH